MKKQDSSEKPIRVGLISLGCAKNLVDAEIMLGSLLQAGMEITNDATKADVVIVNTCSFIDAAQEESVDTILQSSELREKHRPGQGLVVSGCLTQRFREELPKLMPEVDAFMGIDQVARADEIVRQALTHRQARAGTTIRSGKGSSVRAKVRELDREKEAAHGDSESLRGTARHNQTKVVAAPAPPVWDVTARPQYIPDYATPRFRLTPRHFSYVKIAEGCNHPCSFCIIPRMRGSHRSRGQSDVVQEAKALIADGVKELNLISQDTTYYGLDLRPGRSGSIASPEKFNAAARSLPANATTLCTLIRELNELPGDFWIRLLYTHPAHWTDELIQTIAECPKVARYVDMPLQHIHPIMLERMRRETSREYIEELIARIRAGIPGISLRTTFIVGFPGETDAVFESLLQFIDSTRFERLGIFTYSKEEGTLAGRMEGQISNAIKEKRRARAMAAQHRIARELSSSMVGKVIPVLVENEADKRSLQKANVHSWEHGFIREEESLQLGRGRYFVARGEADAPDIDGRVYVRGPMQAGRFAQVRIIGHTDYDLIAEPGKGD